MTLQFGQKIFSYTASAAAGDFAGFGDGTTTFSLLLRSLSLWGGKEKGKQHHFVCVPRV